MRKGGQRFVGADVQRAQDDRPVPHGGRHRLQHRDLFVLARQLIRAEKEELAAKQSDAVGPGGGGALRVLKVGGVTTDLDPAAILGEGRLRVDRQRGRPGNAANRVRRWVDEQRPRIAVEQQGLAVGDGVDQAGDADDGRQAERAGEDRRVRRRRALFGGEPDHQRAVEAGGLRGREVARHHDRGLRRWRGHVAQPEQGATHLLDHVVDISRARLKNRVR